MTRVTNFGRKRKYLDAGFANESATTSGEHPAPEAIKAGGSRGPKKKRKKSNVEGEVDVVTKGERPSVSKRLKKATVSEKRDGAKSIAISGYKKRTEQRRFKRITDRLADTICFVCREKGHAAKTCPNAGGEDGQDDQKNTVVGMCYRCGSTTHTLSRCKKPEDAQNPFPFASCFVCSGKGHLASSCPQNKEKGIYPNGGSCKLCGEKTHLAKDCELRQKDASGTAATTIFGTGGGAGADEDDFHAFKRKNTELSKEEKKEDRRRKRLDVKAGLHTGTVKAFGKNQAFSRPKKVVFF